jgi:hypothetical protein
MQPPRAYAAHGTWCYVLYALFAAVLPPPSSLLTPYLNPPPLTLFPWGLQAVGPLLGPLRGFGCLYSCRRVQVRGGGGGKGGDSGGEEDKWPPAVQQVAVRW